MRRITIIALGVLSLFSCSNPINEIEMQLVEGGNFLMGSDAKEAEDDEKPVHVVGVDSFYLCKYEVSQRLWKYVMGLNPSYFQNPEFPVECVSYDDVHIFLNRLNTITGKKYRLPTEIEWEYAAKGGCMQNEYVYSGGDDPFVVAWFLENSNEQPHSVGRLKGNALGLYDMTGNVHEWCEDYYDGTNYARDTINMETHISYVFRGGSFYSDRQHCRITNRNHAPFDTRNFSLGFRLAHDVE